MADLSERDLTDKTYWRLLASRGTGRFLVLAALAEQPRHGYELARAVTIACDGCCEPSDAMIYPTIKELTQGGYITCRSESQGGRKRNVCELTDRGRAAYRAAAEVWSSVLPALHSAVDGGLAIEPKEQLAEVAV
jgi:PadR family transcriptional regulator, regulatory protein PadR